jgi:hypothetical protein
MVVVLRVDICKETARGRVRFACIGQTLEFVQQFGVWNTWMPIEIKADSDEKNANRPNGYR